MYYLQSIKIDRENFKSKHTNRLKTWKNNVGLKNLEQHFVNSEKGLNSNNNNNHNIDPDYVKVINIWFIVCIKCKLMPTYISVN